MSRITACKYIYFRFNRLDLKKPNGRRVALLGLKVKKNKVSVCHPPAIYHRYLLTKAHIYVTSTERLSNRVWDDGIM